MADRNIIFENLSKFDELAIVDQDRRKLQGEIQKKEQELLRLSNKFDRDTESLEYKMKDVEPGDYYIEIREALGHIRIYKITVFKGGKFDMVEIKTEGAIERKDRYRQEPELVDNDTSIRDV